MSTIVTRSGKGTPLTHEEVDANFTNLNTDKIQSGNTVPVLNINSGNITGNITSSNSTITGGSINNTTVGAVTPSTGKFTTLTDTGLTSGRVTYAGTGGLLSDSANLTFTGTILKTVNFLTDNGYYEINNNIGTTIGYVGVGGALGGGTSDIAIRNDGGSILFGHSGTLQMTLDASGNLGLNAAASSWGSGYKAIQVNGGGISLWSDGSQRGWLSSNLYFNGTNRIYTSTGYATEYAQTIDGKHVWNIAPSGTAGGVVTTTQAMTLDNSGNLAIGNTSASYKLDVTGPDNSGGIIASLYSLNRSANLTFSYNDISASSNSGGLNIRALGANAITFNTNSSERMRIDSAGNVGIGTSSPNSYSGYTTLTLNNATNGSVIDQNVNGIRTGTLISTANQTTLGCSPASGILSFQTGGGNERLRIDTTGNLQVQSGAVMPYAPTHTSISAATTLTNAQLQTQIINTTGTVTFAVTLPTGATLETLASWAGINIGYDFYIVNTNTVAITVGANGNTTLGSLSVAAAASAHYRIRRTAANTFTIYRLG